MTTKTHEVIEEGVAEKKEQYAERYLRSKLFEIVQFYDKDAISNPPEVQAVMQDIINVLVTQYSQKLVKVTRGEERENNKKYREAVHKAYNAGFNVDCIQCGIKDKALGEALTPPTSDEALQDNK